LRDLRQAARRARSEGPPDHGVLPNLRRSRSVALAEGDRLGEEFAAPAEAGAV